MQLQQSTLQLLSEFLQCPVCPPGSLLDKPTTLSCGHTICIHHVPPLSSQGASVQPLKPRSLLLETCPVRSCGTPGSKTALAHGSGVRVFYPRDGIQTQLLIQPPRVDIRVSQIISLVKSHLEDLDADRNNLASSDGEIGGDKGTDEAFKQSLVDLLVCEVCLTVLNDPITTPCQHSFCAQCLQRTLDHSTSCPMCRYEFPSASYFQNHLKNRVLSTIISFVSPETPSIVPDELSRDSELDTPIFVCQLSFPGLPTILHIFEPRYRLMIRRCLENNPPQFGMIMYPATEGDVVHYGTMLEIKSVQMIADGRSIVETWGTSRFRILERGTLDGYMVAKIERVEDLSEMIELEIERNATAIIPPTSLRTVTPPHTLEPAPPGNDLPRSGRNISSFQYPVEPSSEELLETCHSFLDRLRSTSSPLIVQRLNNVGPMPADARLFSFWIAQLLPIDEHEKAKLLPIRSSRLRLRLVVHWIDQFNSAWWSSGCIIA